MNMYYLSYGSNMKVIITATGTASMYVVPTIERADKYFKWSSFLVFYLRSQIQ